ncbi:conserved hypothetical protein [Ricinus communis]|uniref:Fanconi anemia, complementation group D2 n=1 Tax=Ricinus communis TaxID=3988 RepID=B9S9C4_RICCO|nr:conserved hypothetical protein [Ricinus communis]
MVFLHHQAPSRKRPSSSSSSSSFLSPLRPPKIPNSTAAEPPPSSSCSENDGVQAIDKMVSILADAGCTLVNPSGPPCLPSDPLKLRSHLHRLFSSSDNVSALRSIFLTGFSAYINSPKNLQRVLVSSNQYGSNESLLRQLLLVPPIQLDLQMLLLEKLPEFFSLGPECSLEDDVARLIINQFRWLDFIVDSNAFCDKLMQVLSICPLHLKKEIIGSLPEIMKDHNSKAVVDSLGQMLREDSSIVISALDCFSNLYLDDELQEQVVTIAISYIRTIDGEHMPHLLRFLLLSATPQNVQRIISQIRQQLKFIGLSSNSHATQSRKLQGKSLMDNTEASILDALRTSLLFKNMLRQEIMRELISLEKPQDHKVIDLWLLVLIHMNGDSTQKSIEKIFRKKVVDDCIQKVMIDQCICGNKELVQVLGALVTHVGSGVSFEVNSALEAMALLASKYPQELIPFSTHINGNLTDSLYVNSLLFIPISNSISMVQVYEVFSHLALMARSREECFGSSFANELLIILKKQVSHPDVKYKRMGLIGTLKIVSRLTDANEVGSTFQVERLTNGGSLGGIDALLGCPLHLPSSKLNAFCTQVAQGFECISQAMKEDIVAKLLKRLRNLVFLESLLNNFIQGYPMCLPELFLHVQHSGTLSLDHANSTLHVENKNEHKKTHDTASPDKRKHRKILKSSSSGINGKLRQTTVFDVLKKGGAITSQQSLHEDSSHQSLKTPVSANQGSCTEPLILEVPADTKTLDGHRSKFRPLLIQCFSLLEFSKLPLYLYLLGDLHNKLDYFTPGKEMPSRCMGPAPGFSRLISEEFLSKVGPLFPNLRRHFECALSVLKEVVKDTCEEHWKVHSASAGNPDIGNLVFSKSSVSISVSKEILCCFRKFLNLPDVQMEKAVLSDLLEAFQSSKISEVVLSSIQPSPLPGTIEFLYLGASSFLEDVLNTASSISFTLASESLLTLESLVASLHIFFDKSEKTGKSTGSISIHRILPTLRRSLGTSAQKLLRHNWGNGNLENGWKNKGEIVQKMLHIYLENNESQSDLLDELAASIFPRVDSSGTITEDNNLGFGMLCNETFVVWYRVLVLKKIAVTSKIPSTKRAIERFLFHVKALLHATSNARTFWMGNLKHKDLMGQVVGSQVYGDDQDADVDGDLAEAEDNNQPISVASEDKDHHLLNKLNASLHYAEL